MDPLVTIQDHRNGYKDVAIEYHCGAPADGDPLTLRLKAPPRWRARELRIEVQALLNDKSNDPFAPVLLACIEDRYASKEFIGKLDMDCEALLSAIALMLTFGNSVQKKILASMEIAQMSLGSFGLNSPSPAPDSPTPK